MPKRNIKLYDGGHLVGQYFDADVTQIPYGPNPLEFKIQVCVDGKTRTSLFVTTLHSVIEEVIEHSGTISI